MSITTNQQGFLTDRTPYIDDSTPLLPKDNSSKPNSIKVLADMSKPLTASNLKHNPLLSSRILGGRSVVDSSFKYNSRPKDQQDDKQKLKLEVSSLQKQPLNTQQDGLQTQPMSKVRQKKNVGYMSVKVSDYNIKVPTRVSEFEANDKSTGQEPLSEDEPGMARIQFELKQGHGRRLTNTISLLNKSQVNSARTKRYPGYEAIPDLDDSK